MGSHCAKYDDDVDILSLRKKGARTDHSINDRDICIIDFNKNNEVVGLEFLDFADTFNIPKKVLKNLEKVDTTFRYNHQEKIIFILVQLVYKEEKEKIQLPVTADLGGRDFTGKIVSSCAA